MKRTITSCHRLGVLYKYHEHQNGHAVRENEEKTVRQEVTNVACELPLSHHQLCNSGRDEVWLFSVGLS